jgi:hypothetical protein
MAEDKYRETGINYAFKIQRYDSQGRLVAEGALNDDRSWPPAVILTDA